MLVNFIPLVGFKMLPTTNKKENPQVCPMASEDLECVKGDLQERSHWVFLHLESEKYKPHHKQVRGY